MTSRPSAPPLPKPQHPAVAARAVADAAHVVAYTWARPLDRPGTAALSASCTPSCEISASPPGGSPATR